MLQKSGIDIKTFESHSTSSAATSKGFSVGIPIYEVLSAACRSNAKTFAQFYNKPIVERNDSFGKQLLQINDQNKLHNFCL